MTGNSIALDTPGQITMWVLLSRRHQIQLHLKGMKVPGLVKWLKATFPEAGIRTARDGIVPVEFAISQAGGQIDYKLVNVHIMRSNAGLFFDQGIYPDLDTAQAANPQFVEWFQQGYLEVVLTLEEPREATNKIFLPA